MQASYNLHANELNTNFLESIKSMFGDKNIDITITEHKSYELDKRSQELKTRLDTYKKDGVNNCSTLDKEFWIDTKERLVARHQETL